MNDTLKQLKSMIEAIDSAEHIEDSLAYGDYMLLCVNRLVLHEKARAGELSNDELDLLAGLDEHFKLYLTDKQLNDLAKMEAGMPVKKWWG